MGSRRMVVLCLIAVVVTVPACTSSEPQPDPQPTTTSVPTTSLGTPPPVTEPRDVRPFADRPCDLLTVEQRVELGVTEIGFDGFPKLSENRCTWELNDVREQAILRVYPDTDALAAAYAEPGNYGVIRPVDIVGLPGLFRQTVGLSTSCLVTVRTARDQGLSVEYRERSGDVIGDAACREAAVIARTAVRNLPALAS